MTSCKESIIDFYKVRGDVYLENTSISVGWSSNKAQQERFQVLLDIGVTKEDTILDYGCGLGHLIDFLKERNFETEKTYCGLDILDSFILAAKEFYPNHKFIAGEISNIKQNFDYVLGSGTFTISMPWEETLQAIKHVYSIMNKGFAFNLMHKEHPMGKNNYFKTYDPNNVLNILQSNFKTVKLIDNYASKKDFTIYIYK
jgi:SAM-dependent methyltransferase